TPWTGCPSPRRTDGSSDILHCSRPKARGSRGPSRISHRTCRPRRLSLADAAPTLALVDDREMLQRDGKIDRQVGEIAEEFRRGFETVNRLDRPAISIFGSARTPAEDPSYELARATGRGFAARGWAV